MIKIHEYRFRYISMSAFGIASFLFFELITLQVEELASHVMVSSQYLQKVIT
jgi:hypothetical protein